VAQLGYLVLALSLGTEKGVQAGLIYVLNHAVIKAGLFLVAAAVLARVGSTRIADLKGLGRKMPLTMAGLVVGGLGLIGVPGTAGFVSKWYLVLAAIDAGDVYLAAVILLSSLLAVVYVWRLVEVIYFQKGPSLPSATTAPDGAGGEPDGDAPRYLIPAWMLLLASIYFGFFTDSVVGLSGQAAARLVLPVDQQVATTVFSGHVPLREHAHRAQFETDREGAAKAESRKGAERETAGEQP
jgi:multicomponent Na+:H+ antiporter subunit D